MSRTYRASRHHRWAGTTLTTLCILAGAALTYRVWRASAGGILETVSSLTTAVLITSAVSAGWAAHVRRLRDDHAAEWQARRQQREETLLDGEEDRELWDSVEAKTTDDDTIAFGVNVIALDQYRQAG